MDDIVYSEGLTFESFGDGSCLVRSGTCNDSNIIIPPISPAGDKVLAIAPLGFSEQDFIYSIILPSSLYGINDLAFEFCTSLKDVVWSEEPINPVQFTDSVFVGCSSLKHFKFPSNTMTAGSFMFMYCTALISVIIPNTLGKGECVGIGQPAINFTDLTGWFDGCPNLQDVYFTGTKEEWDALPGSDSTGMPPTATIHYNYVDLTKTVGGKLTRTNNAIRSLTGLTDKLTLDEMNTNLQSVVAEVETQSELIDEIISKLTPTNIEAPVIPITISHAYSYMYWDATGSFRQATTEDDIEALNGIVLFSNNAALLITVTGNHIRSTTEDFISIKMLESGEIRVSPVPM